MWTPGSFVWGAGWGGGGGQGGNGSVCFHKKNLNIDVHVCKVSSRRQQT